MRFLFKILDLVLWAFLALLVSTALFIKHKTGL